MPLSSNLSAQTKDGNDYASPEALLKLHVIMADIFGAQWTNARGVKPDYRGEWARALSGISQQEMRFALDRCHSLTYCPNISEFRALCFGLYGGDSEASYQRFINRNCLFTSPINKEPQDDAERWTRREVGRFVSVANPLKGLELWTRAYSKNRRLMITGELAPYNLKALTHG